MTIQKARKLIAKLTNKIVKEVNANKVETMMLKIDILRDFINFELDLKNRS